MPDAATYDAVLVLANISDFDPQFLGPVISTAAATTRNRLTVVLVSRHFDTVPDHSESPSHTASWNDIQNLLTFIYVRATTVAQELDRVLMDVEVLLKGVKPGLTDELAAGVELCYRVEGDVLPVKIPPAISLLRTIYHPPAIASPPVQKGSLVDVQGSKFRLYPVVALGGTFDHLHAGHKILLSMGSWTASQKLIVGVTDDALLVSKAFAEVLEPIRVRMDRVRTFLLRFKPGLEYDIVPISDVYGPTGWDANIQALVVSSETLSGATSIASHRASLGLPPLENFIIDVISPTSSKLDPKDAELLKKAKMSSSFIRKWIVSNRKT